MSTKFHVPENGARSTIASPRSGGDPTLVLTDGSGFGSAYPKAITVVRGSTVISILEATGRSANTATITQPLEGASDVNMQAGDFAEIRITAGAIIEIQGAVHNLEASPQVAISGAITLDATAYGATLHCSGTSANYTIILPTAVGHAGERIKLHMASTLTRLVTIATAGGQTIDGAPSRVMFANESATLESDNANWYKAGGRSIPMACALQPTGNGGVSGGASPSQVTLDGIIGDNTGLMADPADGTIVVARPGNYHVLGQVRWANLSADSPRCMAQVHRNGLVIADADGSAVAAALPKSTAITPSAPLAAGDFITLFAFNAVTANFLGAAFSPATTLYVTEVPSW